MFLEEFNQNLYIRCLSKINGGLSKIEQLIDNIKEFSDYRNIDNLVSVYTDIFSETPLSNHIHLNIERIYKPLYLSNPGPHTKGNSYWHIKLGISSDEMLWLDHIYDFKLTNQLKLLKHTFSKIDNFFINLNPAQLNKYQELVISIQNETDKFIEYIRHRDILDKRKKLDQQKLLKIPFGSLFYTAHIENLSSILEVGILSHNLAHSRGLVQKDISNLQVNERRNRVVSTLEGNIHDFAPLYFNPRNPMLFVLCKQSVKENLVLIGVTPHILLEENVYFSDGNAAANRTHFYSNIEDFNKLNWEVIRKEFWIDHPDGKRIKCSEVLVRENIPLYFVTDIFVYNENALKRILPLFPNHLGIRTSVNQKYYF